MGDVTSDDRFVRLSYLMQHVPRADDAATTIGYIRGVLMNAAVPQGAPYGSESSVYPTWWASLLDLEGLVYHWGWTLNDNILQVDLRRLQAEGRFNEGASPLALNPRAKALAGDVSSIFCPTELVARASSDTGVVQQCSLPAHAGEPLI